MNWPDIANKLMTICYLLFAHLFLLFIDLRDLHLTFRYYVVELVEKKNVIRLFKLP